MVEKNGESTPRDMAGMFQVSPFLGAPAGTDQGIHGNDAAARPESSKHATSLTGLFNMEWTPMLKHGKVNQQKPVKLRKPNSHFKSRLSGSLHFTCHPDFVQTRIFLVGEARVPRLRQVQRPLPAAPTAAGAHGSVHGDLAGLESPSTRRLGVVPFFGGLGPSWFPFKKATKKVSNLQNRQTHGWFQTLRH